MNCKTVQTHLSAYLDRELAGDQMLELRAHLNSCTDCREEEASLRSLKSLLGGLPIPDPSPDFEERLTLSLASARSVQTSTRNYRTSVFLFAGVAAGAMAMTLSFLSNSSGQAAAAVARDKSITFEAQRYHEVYNRGADAYGGPIITANYDGR